MQVAQFLNFRSSLNIFLQKNDKFFTGKGFQTKQVLEYFCTGVYNAGL